MNDPNLQAAVDSITLADQEHVAALAAADELIATARADAEVARARHAEEVAAHAVTLALLSAANDRIMTLAADLAAAEQRIRELLGYQGPVTLIGMAAEDSKWDERVALTGPVNARRLYAGGNWNHAGLMSDIEECLTAGMYPYASMKYSNSGSILTVWQSVIDGAYDVRARQLAQAIVDLDAGPGGVRLAFHHEPRGGAASTVQHLALWAKAHTRMNQIVKDVAGDAIRVGPCDNGHPWGIKWGALTDTQLAVYYTPEFLATCDDLGMDAYDGATNTNPGEPAHVKMTQFAAWADRIGFEGGLDLGEWNFIDPQDCLDAWPILASRYWLSCLFNSAANNRADLPSELGGSWELRPGSARLAAFREILARSNREA